MNKRPMWIVAVLIALTMLVLFITRSRSPYLPTTYNGISLPTPAPVGDAQLPPLWLIIQGKAIGGTLQGSHLSDGRVIESDVDMLLQTGELAAAAVRADEPIVLIGTNSITGIQAKIVNDAPRGSDAQSLSVDGKMEGETAVFTFELLGYSDNQFLRVTLHFTEGSISGIATYVWHLIPTTGNASSSPTPVSSVGSLSPCDVLPAPASTPPVLPTPHPDLIYLRSPEEMTREADLIILGTVSDPSISHFDPPFGNSKTGALIVTDTAVQVECVLKGVSPDATIMVRTEGGCVGEECMEVSHGAQIQLGQRAIMFLQRKGFDYVTLLNSDGVYEVQAEYMYYTFGDYLDLAGDRIVSDYYNLSVAELLATIQSNIR